MFENKFDNHVKDFFNEETQKITTLFCAQVHGVPLMNACLREAL